ncbi:MAG: PAS domain S-box protein [Candidatus Zixiibacteriota bacterium]
MINKLSTQRRFQLLLSVLAVGAVSIIYSLHSAEEAKVDQVIKNSLAHLDRDLEQSIEQGGGPIRTLCNDYSRWDEMITFVQSRDTQWARETLVPALTSADGDVAWVFDGSASLLYAASTGAARERNILAELDSAASKSLTGNTFAHFFTGVSEGVIEFWGAPIQPTADHSRSAPVYGTFVVGRIWNADRLAQLAGRLGFGARLSVVRGHEESRESSFETSDRDTYRVTRPLPGPDHAPIATLVGDFDLPLSRELQSAHGRYLIYTVVFAAMMMFLFSFAISRWFSRPLTTICDSLEARDTGGLARLETSGPEMSRIASTIAVFLEQARTLEGNEAALTASERRYRITAEQTGQIIYDWDVSGKQVSRAGAIQQITGYTPAEYQAFDIDVWREAVHPDDRERVSAALAETIRHGGTFHAEYRMRVKDGSYRYIEDVGSMVSEADSGSAHLLGNMKDVTDRRLAAESLQESENRFRTLFEGARDAIVIWDSETGHVLDANEQATALFARSRWDLIGMHRSELHPPDHAHEYDALLGAQNTGESSQAVEVEILTFYGLRVHAEVSANVLVLADGRHVVQGIFHDISQRKKYEEQLRSQYNFLQQFLDTIPNPVYYKDAEGRFLGLNSAFERVAGVKRDVLIGRTAFESCPADPTLLHASTSSELQRKPGVRVFEAPMTFADGSRHDIIYHEATFSGPDQEVAGVVGVMIDNTDQRNVMRALKESENKFRTVFEHSSDAILLLTDSVIDCNEKACDLFGGSRDELVGRTPDDLSPTVQPDGRASGDLTPELIAQALDGKPQFFTWQVRRLTGELVDTEISLNAITLQGRSVLHATVRDITARRQAEEQIKKLAAAVAQTAEAVVITDPSGSIEYVNPAFERMTQYRAGEVRGKNPRILRSGKQDAAFYEEMWRMLSEGKIWHGRLVNLRKDGSSYTEDMTISPVLDHHGNCTNFVAVKRDVSHEVALEQMLAQSQKMEAVGRLAGGVAHDFNNLLTVIAGYSDILVRKLQADERLQGDAVEIKKAADRATALTRQLLAFSRRQVGQRQTINLNTLITDMNKMLKRLIGENIEMDLRIEADQAVVLADPGQIEQVVMNLVVNARDAMPEGGRLRLATTNQTLSEERTIGRFVLRAGSYVTLQVSDNGAGMNEETLTHIFEPFFTTKQVGQGTGLGLATIYGIVKQMEGGIEVTSEPGLGTTFTIFLPRSDKPGEPVSVDNSKPAAAKGETILLVEDEEIVRSLVSKMLKDLDYQVVTCESPEIALEYAFDLTRGIDLLLSDVIMPKLDGRQLAEQFRAIRPQTKILFMSGYQDTILSEEFLAAIGAGIITKPFSRDTVARKIRETLDAQPAPTAA